MSSPISVKRAVAVVCGVSAALVCASAAGLYWYKRRRNRRKPPSKSKSPVSKRQSSPKLARNNSTSSKNEEKQIRNVNDEANWKEEQNDGNYTSDLSSSEEDGEMVLKNRGRKKNRPQVKPKNKSAVQAERDWAEKEKSIVVQPQQQQPNKKQDTRSTTSDSALVTNGLSNGHAATKEAIAAPVQDRIVWSEEMERSDSGTSSEAEIASAGLSNGTTKPSNGGRIQSSNVRSFGSFDGEVSNGLSGSALQNGSGISHIIRDSPAVSSVKSQCADSPSLGSDLHSEASQDSGKGASMGVTSSMSPVEELIEVPPVYEFEVPRDIVGLLIGKKGTTIKWLTEQSQAYIVIRDHFYSEKHKICTLEGTREQINKCLRLIRRKFPPSRFPELRLTPILPPPASTTPRTPVWDNVVQLNLPEGVNCEVAVSSIVNIGHIFVQQPTHPTFSSLSRLDQYMLAVYGQPASVPPLPRPIEMGVICAAPVLGGWYRAQTIDVYDDDTDEALVRFVDYGGYCRVPASDLRQIRSDFMTLPFQSTECYLSNITPVNETEGWSPEATKYFESLSLSKIIEARVTGHASDNTPLVELYTTGSDSKPILINRVLVDNGYALWTEM